MSITSDESGRKLLQLLSCDRYQMNEVLEQPIDLEDANLVWLRCEFVKESLQFSWSTDGDKWLFAGPAVDGSILSDDYVRDEMNRYRPAFTGAFVGMCCQDLTGEKLHADFHHFEYLDRC